MKELESGEVEYESVEEFFTNLKREFGVDESGRAKTVGTGRKNNGGVCSNIQKGSKGKWV